MRHHKRFKDLHFFQIYPLHKTIFQFNMENVGKKPPIQKGRFKINEITTLQKLAEWLKMLKVNIFH